MNDAPLFFLYLVAGGGGTMLAYTLLDAFSVEIPDVLAQEHRMIAFTLLSCLLWPLWAAVALYAALRGIAKLFPRRVRRVEIPRVQTVEPGRAYVRVSNCVAKGDIIAIATAPARAGEYTVVTLDFEEKKS